MERLLEEIRKLKMDLGTMDWHRGYNEGVEDALKIIEGFMDEMKEKEGGE